MGGGGVEAYLGTDPSREVEHALFQRIPREGL